MKIHKEDIPIVMEAPGTIMRTLKGFGGLKLVLTNYLLVRISRRYYRG